MATWILTASPDNHAATAEHGFGVIGLKERNRNRALQIEPGDVVVLYLTKVMRFAGAMRVTGELYEDREKLWPGKPGKADAYPWRFPTEPVVVLDEDDWIAAEDLKSDLEHVRKWPAEHWKLAFQGQVRTISDADAELLLDRLRAAAGARA
jgi:predicted RNA-binding protein